jgi:hypothetical protein
MSEKEEQRPQDQEDPKGGEAWRGRAEQPDDDQGPDVEGHVKKAARVGARVGFKPKH